MEGTKTRGVQEIGRYLAGAAGSGNDDQRQSASGAATADVQGGTIYTELCFECHGTDGAGAPLAGAPAGTTMAPPLAGSPRVQGHRDYVIKALLHGLTGPLAGRTYTQVMIPLAAQNDEWIAAVASYVRNSFGNKATFVSPADVARVRAATASRKAIWTQPELEGSLPLLLQAQPTWKLTASHNAAAATGGLTTFGWNSGEPQKAGMWFQVELPEAVSVAEVQFDRPPVGVWAAVAAAVLSSRPARAREGRPVRRRQWQPPTDLSRKPDAALGPPRSHGRCRFPAGISGSAVARREGLGKASRDGARESAYRVVAESNEGEIHPDHPDGSAPDAPAWVIENPRVYQAPPTTAGRTQ